jgi:hypothetical protein
MAEGPNAAFLYAAINDTQGTVRALDVKAEVLLAAMTAALSRAYGVSMIVWGMMTQGHMAVRILSAAASVVLLLSWIASYVCSFRVLVGSPNPAKAIPDHAPANGAFFAGHLFRFRALDLLRDRPVISSRSLQDHLALLPVGDEATIAELAFEQLKLAYICGRKIAMFHFAVKMAVVGVGAGLVLLILRNFA